MKKSFSVIFVVAAFVPIMVAAALSDQPVSPRPAPATTQNVVRPATPAKRSTAKKPVPQKKSITPPRPAAVPQGKKISKPLSQLPGPADKKLVEQYPQGIAYLPLDDFTKLKVASSKTIGVSLRSSETVTVGAVNAFLAAYQAKLGGFQAVTGELYLAIPEVVLPQTLISLLDRVQKSPIVDFAFPILKYEVTVLPAYSKGAWHWPWVLSADAVDEFYELKQSGDPELSEVPNMHLKGIRAPQSWVFVDFCDKPQNAGKCPSYAKDYWTALVLDSGFVDHPELPRYPKGRVLVASNQTSEHKEHGTNVIGILAAPHDGKGIEGVNPRNSGIVFQSFLATNVDQSIPHFYWINTLRVANQSFGSSMGKVLADLQAKARQGGENDKKYYEDTLAAYTRMANLSSQRVLKQVLLLMRSRERTNNPRPFYIVSASDNTAEISGLDPGLSSGFCGAAEGLYGDVYANAAKRVICVGNFNPDSGSVISADHNAINANGAYILTTSSADAPAPMGVAKGYDYALGSSFATPQVAAALDYLLTFADSQIAWDLKRLLFESARTVNQRKVLDIFAALMQIDEENGKVNAAWDRELQRYLVDVNVNNPRDLDGNPRPGRSVKTRGDGFVDIRDFRVFRDALYQVVNDTLDFPNDKSKRNDASKDLNGDGCVNGADAQCNIKENVYPRYDFNGDGIISAKKAVKFKGKNWTDLDVLADLWPKNGDKTRDGTALTPDELMELTNGYDKSELANLAPNSGDLHVTTTFTADFDELRLTFTPAGSKSTMRRIVFGTKLPTIVQTVPANMPVELVAVPYKNGVPIKAKDPVLEQCVSKDGKAGTRTVFEKIRVVVSGEGLNSIELPAQLPSLESAEDKAYALYVFKDKEVSDCRTKEQSGKSNDGNGTAQPASDAWYDVVGSEGLFCNGTGLPYPSAGSARFGNCLLAKACGNRQSYDAQTGRPTGYIHPEADYATVVRPSNGEAYGPPVFFCGIFVWNQSNENISCPDPNNIFSQGIVDSICANPTDRSQWSPDAAELVDRARAAYFEARNVYNREHPNTPIQ